MDVFTFPILLDQRVTSNKRKKIIKLLQERKVPIGFGTKNIHLFPKVLLGIEQAVNDQSCSFKRYSIGFDAKFMGILRRVLGYILFNKVVKSRLGL